MPDPVFCPECHAEYLWSATVCVECDVALVPESALGGRAASELPPVSQLVCIRAAAIGWCQALSERLLEAGISHRIEVAEDEEEEGAERRPGANLPYGVYVLPEDEAAAVAVDAAFMRSQIPDLPEADASAPDAGSCPACGEAVSPDAQECPECGLALFTG
jgi:hypothetical protein